MGFVSSLLYPLRKYLQHDAFCPIFSNDVTLNIYFAQRRTNITDIHAEEQRVNLSGEQLAPQEIFAMRRNAATSLCLFRFLKLVHAIPSSSRENSGVR